MAERQIAKLPFHNGNKYKIFNASNPATPGIMVTYDPEPVGPNNFHIDNKYRFRKNDGSYIFIPHFRENDRYGIEGIFVGYTGNSGGTRRKSRRSKRSKRSKRSHRKTKRRHH